MSRSISLLVNERFCANLQLAMEMNKFNLLQLEFNLNYIRQVIFMHEICNPGNDLTQTNNTIKFTGSSTSSGSSTPIDALDNNTD